MAQRRSRGFKSVELHPLRRVKDSWTHHVADMNPTDLITVSFKKPLKTVRYFSLGFSGPMND